MKNIKQWLELDPEERQQHFLYIDDDQVFDIGRIIFGNEPAKSNYVCELCLPAMVGQHDELWGTSDSREPKFCLAHYVKVNENALFATGPELEETKQKVSDATKKLVLEIEETLEDLESAVADVESTANKAKNLFMKLRHELDIIQRN